jgi:hypothetical protein
VLTLTVEALCLYEMPVIRPSALQVLDNGLVYVPQTPVPWEERAQKNVYPAGHRLGYPGTGSAELIDCACLESRAASGIDVSELRRACIQGRVRRRVNRFSGPNLIRRSIPMTIW